MYLEVPLLGCNSTVNIRSIEQIDENMPEEFWQWLEKLVNNTTKLKKERGVLRKNNLKSDKALIFAVLLITMSVAGCQDKAVIIQNAESSKLGISKTKEVAGIVKNRDANEFIYGVGFAISADLEFAKRKALALAKMTWQNK